VSKEKGQRMSGSYKNKIRFITAASLFDGHDASINIMRRILQAQGAEVIHLGHNRSVRDVVRAALQEDVQGIAMSSYQGGHMEYFKYMHDLLKEAGAPHIKIFGGGGGVIIHEEKKALEDYGIARIYHPDDGRRLGLDGMIKEMMELCDFDTLAVSNRQDFFKTIAKKFDLKPQDQTFETKLGTLLTVVEAHEEKRLDSSLLDTSWIKAHIARQKSPLIIGITGTGGAGKSSLTDELLQRFLNVFPERNFGVVCVDPSKKKTGGALLGDRIRMNALSRDHVFMRSMATRGSGREVSHSLKDAVGLMQNSGFDLLFVETIGIGQGDTAITELCDLSLYVMTSEYGAASQLEKIDMIDFADFIAINKFDRRGSEDALRDVRKQYRRSHKLFDKTVDSELPIFGTIASQFNDAGVNHLFHLLCDKLVEKGDKKFELAGKPALLVGERRTILPVDRQNYLAEITSSVRGYKRHVREQAAVASELGHLHHTSEILRKNAKAADSTQALKTIESYRMELEKKFEPAFKKLLESWDHLKTTYGSKDELVYKVRDKEIRQPLVSTSLSGLKIRRVALPDYQDWGDRLKYLALENTPGTFPYTAGVFPLKRLEEEPRRQFAGEGPPERTNSRFHYLSKGEKAKRLSTAFDSVTLYGEDPNERPDIYGKVGESGVSICTLEDMKKLYKGFDLCDPSTSVSMTINGPAPIVLAFFLNTAIDQQVEAFTQKTDHAPSTQELETIRAQTLKTVRGTVQADILKEDQAQNTCIFSTEFSLKLMGDIQEYFIKSEVRNYYSVSISGYHIAEAGANPISQTAFTLSNGFTYVEYYLSRGMRVDDFAPNLSFFFSNGLDPEYSVIGRVARRIWAIAMKNRYHANDRSQKLKYHIQTSGRSLHAQEIAFNDIRTTLQALIAIYDSCNSLHTNAYDEAITTPTQESVRRAMAIQMIINREFGLAKNENPIQGAYIINELTELVEEAVLSEFMRINERGGVLGAMETQYQRGKIQEESLYYEQLKHSGELPIIGVNTFIDPETLKPGYVPPKVELARSSKAEKDQQIRNLRGFQKEHSAESGKALARLKKVSLENGNIFAEIMQAARSCSLGQISQALYEVGGQYRRSL